jgi:hypothetical protein
LENEKRIDRKEIKKYLWNESYFLLNIFYFY